MYTLTLRNVITYMFSLCCLLILMNVVVSTISYYVTKSMSSSAGVLLILLVIVLYILGNYYSHRYVYNSICSFCQEQYKKSV